MASTPAPPNKDEEVNNPPTSGSYYRKTFCLQDWWLIKAEKDFQGRSIAVAGTSRENSAVRTFSSAPILKTYDLHILETVDEVSVILKGFINKERTKENGFSSEVFEHFVFGFPPNWERCAERCFVGGSSINRTSKMVEGSSVEDSTNSSLASDRLSTDSGSNTHKTRNSIFLYSFLILYYLIFAKNADVGDLYEATSNRNESTSNSGACGNNDEMDQGLENVAARQTPMKSSSTTPVVAPLVRKESTSDSEAYGKNNEMGQDLENVADRQTPIKSSSATPVVAHMEDIHGATPDRAACTSNSGGCGNDDEMDQVLRNISAGQIQTESSPANPDKIVDVDKLLEQTPNGKESSCNLGGCGNFDTMDHGLKNSSTGQTLTESSPATPVVARTEGRMDDFSFVKSVAGGKSMVKYVSRSSPYQLRRAAYGGGKSGRRSNFTQPEVGVANTMADKTQEQISGNKASQASKPSKRTRRTLKSSIGVSDVSQKNKQNVADKETTAKDSGRSKKKTKRELIYESPLVQEKAVDTSSNSTESLSFKRSRSGRLLVPALEFWRNQRVVYDADRTIIAFVEGLDDMERNSHAFVKGCCNL